jgi:uncharacterized protein YecT (DUF1311 family)
MPNHIPRRRLLAPLGSIPMGLRTAQFRGKVNFIATALSTLVLSVPTQASPLKAEYAAVKAIEKRCAKQFETRGRGADWHFAGCQQEVQAVWEKALNTAYTNLLAVVPKSCAELARNAQGAWQTYRESDAAAFAVIAGVRPGSNMLASAERKTQVLRERTVLLLSLQESARDNTGMVCPKE